MVKIKVTSLVCVCVHVHTHTHTYYLGYNMKVTINERNQYMISTEN